jgi:cyclopropane fatty-acyl-phospholipid synthase-like methyltransferase
MLKPHQDAYGQELHAYYQGEEIVEIVERDDGFIGTSGGPAFYFAEFEEWPAGEQEAMTYARGRVLDVGAGAGRVSLYLQKQGHEVVAIDNSPLALEVCRLRGVEHTSPTPITQVSKKLGCFDTIVMLGNNFGLFGNSRRARWLLRRFNGMTSPEARIIAESNDIYQTDNRDHLAYQQRNRDRGRMSGQIRLRVRTGKYASPWFDYLMVSRDEMQEILDGTGWEVERFIENPDRPSYVAIIQKAVR